MTPKVFISHASEDKKRFVLDFAARLCANGIDPWVDKWEMLPGDSLVDKIFQEGLREATAIIAIISQHSISKPWVREEINAAFVKRINTGSKLIPVIIDDCEIPMALTSTLWIKIDDLTSYDGSFDQIVAAIFGTKDKPSIGQPPDYINQLNIKISSLTRVDSLVLKRACDEALSTGNDILNIGTIYTIDDKPIVPEAELLESLEMLDRQNYIKLVRHFGGFSHLQLTLTGLNAYVTTFPDFKQVVTDVISALVNKSIVDNASLQSSLNKPMLLVDHILDMLEAYRHIQQSKLIGGMRRIYNISPALNRMLDNNEYPF